MPVVLVVDNDPVWLAETGAELSGAGFAVRTASTGREALASIVVEPPDAVVVEVHLPGMDGLDLMARILDRHPKMPVVLHSACVAYRDNFLSWAADAYVAKAAGTTDLTDALREAMGRRGMEAPRPRLVPVEAEEAALVLG